jgi:hypothetical protein
LPFQLGKSIEATEIDADVGDNVVKTTRRARSSIKSLHRE